VGGAAATQTFAPGGKYPRAATGGGEETERNGRGKGKREEGRDPQWQNFFV